MNTRKRLIAITTLLALALLVFWFFKDPKPEFTDPRLIHADPFIQNSEMNEFSLWKLWRSTSAKIIPHLGTAEECETPATCFTIFRIPLVKKNKMQLGLESNDWGKDNTKEAIIFSKSKRFPWVLEAKTPKLPEGSPYVLRGMKGGEEHFSPTSEAIRFSNNKSAHIWANLSYPLHIVHQDESNKRIEEFRFRNQRIAEIEIESAAKNIIASKEPLSYFQKLIAADGPQKIQNLGFNTVQIMPLWLSRDFDRSWQEHYRNLNPYTLDPRYGTAEELSKLVENFHSKNMAVILDYPLFHFIGEGKLGPLLINSFALNSWSNKDASSYFGNQFTQWRTTAYDFSSEYVQDYLIEGMLSGVLRYDVDGVRIPTARYF